MSDGIIKKQDLKYTKNHDNKWINKIKIKQGYDQLYLNK